MSSGHNNTKQNMLKILSKEEKVATNKTTVFVILYQAFHNTATPKPVGVGCSVLVKIHSRHIWKSPLIKQPAWSLRSLGVSHGVLGYLHQVQLRKY